jgi:hypothetical protein
MKVYTYSTARARLSSVLEESKTEEIIIKRRKGELYAVTPKTAVPRSPFDDVQQHAEARLVLQQFAGIDLGGAGERVFYFAAGRNTKRTAQARSTRTLLSFACFRNLCFKTLFLFDLALF